MTNTTAKLGQPLKASYPGACARRYHYDALGRRTTASGGLAAIMLS